MATQKAKVKVTQDVKKHATHVTQQQHTYHHHGHPFVEIDFQHGSVSHDAAVATNQPPSFVIPSHGAELVKNLPAMETEWTTLPYAIPDTAEDHQRINEILTYSLRRQKEEEISDNSAFIIVVINRCLNALGIDNSMEFGYRTINKESVPHVWLNIQGFVIDNTYQKELQLHSTNYLLENIPSCYKECERYDYPEMEKPHPKPNTRVDTAEMTNTLMKRRIDFYMQMPERAIPLSLNREQAYSFYFAMIRHMFDEYRVSIKGVDPKARLACWYCRCFPRGGVNFFNDVVERPDHHLVKSSSGSTWKFSRCDKCMVANYCSADCQKKDWLSHHSLFCLSRGPVYLPPLGDIPFLSDPVR